MILNIVFVLASGSFIFVALSWLAMLAKCPVYCRAASAQAAGSFMVGEEERDAVHQPKLRQIDIVIILM